MVPSVLEHAQPSCFLPWGLRTCCSFCLECCNQILQWLFCPHCLNLNFSFSERLSHTHNVKKKKTQKTFCMGLSDLANKNTKHSVKFEFQINNKEYFGTSCAMFGTYIYSNIIHSLFIWNSNLIGCPAIYLATPPPQPLCVISCFIFSVGHFTIRNSVWFFHWNMGSMRVGPSPPCSQLHPQSLSYGVTHSRCSINIC